MPVSVVTVEMHLPAARSLKDKRRIVKSLKDKIHARYRVSIAETRFHDLHQRAQLGVAAVASDGRHLGEIIDGVRAQLDSRFDVQLTAWDEQILDLGGAIGFGETTGLVE